MSLESWFCYRAFPVLVGVSLTIGGLAMAVAAFVAALEGLGDPYSVTQADAWRWTLPILAGFFLFFSGIVILIAPALVEEQ